MLHKWPQTTMVILPPAQAQQQFVTVCDRGAVHPKFIINHKDYYLSIPNWKDN